MVTLFTIIFFGVIIILLGALIYNIIGMEKIYRKIIKMAKEWNEKETDEYEDGYTEWVARFPDVKGCIGVGDNAEEAMKEAYEALEFNESLNELNIDIPISTNEKIY